MRRFFSFRSSTANAGNGNGAPAHKKRNEKTLEEDDSSGSSRSPKISAFRSRSRKEYLKNEEASNPQLRRCLSFSSSATPRGVEERSLSFLGDLSRSMSNSSGGPHHVGDCQADCYQCSPERHPGIREYITKVQKTHGVQETESPGSRGYSCSAGHSPISSPVMLRCRPARLTNLLNKNEVLDLYIDGEQEAMKVNEKQKQKPHIRSAVSNLGRPPRAQSTVPSSPKSTKEILRTYSNVDVKNVSHHQFTQECRNASRNHGRIFDAFSEKFPNLEEYKSENLTAVEDIYEDLADVQPPNFCGTSMDPVSDLTSQCFIVDCHCPEESLGFHRQSCLKHCSSGLENDKLDFAPEEHDSDEKLLRRAKEVEVRFMVPSGDNYELIMLRDKRLSSTDVFQMIQSLIEDRKQLALELSSQIKARLTERFAAKEQYKQSKMELDTRTRRLEKEKTEEQATLERELDRRSNDWSLKLVRFQSEEQRLRERVRELAEQNVSFQREVTLLEANKADASTRVMSLEMQNKELSDVLQKVRNEYHNLHNSSMELEDRFTKAAEERDHIQGGLKDKEEENKALHKVIARLQRICNEQEKTITGLRQGYNAELDKKSVESSDNRMQMELVRLTGVEQKLRREVQSCRLETESLRQENIALFSRLRSSGNGSSFSSISLDHELHARVDSLQTQCLSLLHDASQLCAKLLDLIKCKRHENESVSDIDALTAIDYTLKYQSIKGGVESLKRSLRTIKSVLAEKQNAEENTEETAGGDSPSRQRNHQLSVDEIELKLKEEDMLNRVLKEKLLSKELELEQLQSDLASSVRIQDVMKNEIQRVHDELACLTHKCKHLELQVLKKDESTSQIQQDFQESAKELAAIRGTLKTVTEERDILWEEAKQLRKTISLMQNDIASLRKKIESLDEDILLKEGEISILRDSIDKPFDIICSPRSMKEFDME